MKNNLSISKYIVRIPDNFFSKTAFGLLMILILTMPLTYLVKVFSIYNIHKDLLNIVETFIQLFVFLYLLKLLFSEKIRSIKLTAWDKMFLGVLLFATISACLAEDKELAFIGTGYRVEGLSTYFCYAAIYICAKFLIESRHQKILIITFTGSISLLSTMTLIQAWPALKEALGTIGYNLYGNGFTTAKFSGIFQNSNHYAYMLTMGILGFAALFVFSKGMMSVLSIILYSFNLWALIVNRTFGSYLAVLSGLLFFSIILYLKDRLLLKKWCLLLLLFLSLSLFCQLNGSGRIGEDFATLQSDIENLSENENAGSGRIALWTQALHYISDKPVFGYGPEGLYHPYLDDGFLNDRPHNEYLQMAAFHGIPALCMYLGGLLSLLLLCMKNLKKLSPELIIIGCMILGYCVSAFFGNTMYYTTPYFFLFLGILSTCKTVLNT